MKYLLLTAMALGAFAFTTPSVLADNHDEDMKYETPDTNGDGKISKSEFMTKNEMRFSKIDADNDGFLTKDEMKSARQKVKEHRMKMKDMRKGDAAEATE